MKRTVYYVTLQVDLFPEDEQTDENILSLLTGLDLEDLQDSLVSIDEK